MNKKILASMDYPNIGDKDFLRIVLVETTTDYVVWTHNKTDNGYFNGNYFPKRSFPTIRKAKQIAYKKFLKDVTELVKCYA